MPSWSYKVILIAATVIWGGNFVVSKYAVDEIGSAWVVGIRFLVGGVLMGLVLFPRLKKHMSRDLLKAGIIIGFFSFLGYWSQFLGLEGTTPAKNAFLSTCYCITVPFIWWLVAKRRPTKRNLLAAAVCVCGLAFVTLRGDLSISWGDGVSILSAFLYGAEIVAIAIFLRDHDVLCVTVVQMTTSGILGIILGLFVSPVPTAAQLLSPDLLAQMAYITLLASCFASTAQNLAQSHVPPAQVSLFFALESVFGTIFSVLFWGEAITAQTLLGFALIFLAILISEFGSKRKDPDSTESNETA